MNFNKWDSKSVIKSRSIITIFLSRETFLFLILTQKSKAKCQSKHKNKHKNNIQLIDCLASSCQFSLKCLSLFAQPADFRLWSRAKRVVDLTESISEVFKQSQSQNQSQIKNQNQFKSKSNQLIWQACLSETASLNLFHLCLSFHSKVTTASEVLARWAADL